MRKRQSRPPLRWLRTSLAATFVAMGLLLLVATSALANSVNVYDRSGVLNQSQVSNAASGMSYAIDIYTIPNFTGTQSHFDQYTYGSLKNSNMFVLAIDTNQRQFSLAWGKNVSFTNNEASGVYQSFKSSYSNGGYTAATVAALNTLKSDVGGSGSGFGGFSWLIIVGIIILVIIVLVAFRASRRRRMGYVGMPAAPPMYNPNPYNQGYPPGYNQGQGQGMNPWAAGGLGAAAGGLIGYELGKEQGEREGGGGFGGGGGGGGDFGGGFGGGGGGGDFGGGFGGGGGGGGGGDFGGGFGGGGGNDGGGGGGGSF